MYIGTDLNDYGTVISQHICDTCGDAFTVCPAQDPEGHAYNNCLAETCESYDPARDIDKAWDNSEGAVAAVKALGGLQLFRIERQSVTPEPSEQPRAKR